MALRKRRWRFDTLAVRMLPALTIGLLAVALVLSFALPGGSYTMESGGSTAGGALRVLVLGMLSLAALLIAVVLPRMMRRAVGRYRHSDPPHLSGTESAISVDAVGSLRRLGWTVAAEGPDAVRLAKHRWSVWSPLLLHIGLVVVLASAFLAFASESRGVLVLHEGEQILAGTSLQGAVVGVLGSEPVLPGTILGGAVTPAYWPQGGTRQLTAEHVDVETGEPVVLEVNRITRWRGVRLFPSQTWGRVYYVRFDGAELSEQVLQIDVPAGAGLGEAGYRDLDLGQSPYDVRLKAIENVSAEGAVQPTLVLRLEEDGEVAAQEELSLLTTATVGPYAVSLLSADETWQEIFVVRQTGVGTLMVGIVLVVVGSVALYLFPPADVWVVKDGDVDRLVVRAGKLGQTGVADQIARAMEAHE
ncbi:MAG: hypothetical protein Q7W51_06765 [Coriobacteriia bacterium]|nr:hypothetical protein [Coriobacteriia bacterium]